MSEKSKVRAELAFNYNGQAIDALAHKELAFLANPQKMISMRALNSLHEVYTQPAQVRVHFEAIPAYFHPYLRMHQTTFDSLSHLRVDFSSVMERLKKQTPCQYTTTLLINGAYIGDPAQLFAFWSGKTRTAEQVACGLGVKVASVGYLDSVLEHIQF